MRQVLRAPVLRPAVFSFYPATRSGILEKKVLSKFEEILSKKAAELAEEKEGLLQTLQLTTEGHGDKADKSIIEIKQNASAVLSTISPELPKFRLALMRVRNDLKGSERSSSQAPFGKCLEKGCGNFIERERLDAVPIAPTCMTHTHGFVCVTDGKSHRN